jgi:hypothetical protein
MRPFWSKIRKKSRWVFMYILIILLAGYLIARFTHSFISYSPGYYEPKDFERGDWLKKQE